MRTDFSPTLLAARRLDRSVLPARPGTGSTPPMESRSCPWPRRHTPAPVRTGIWQALQQIQARHA